MGRSPAHGDRLLAPPRVCCGEKLLSSLPEPAMGHKRQCVPEHTTEPGLGFTLVKSASGPSCIGRPAHSPQSCRKPIMSITSRLSHPATTLLPPPPGGSQWASRTVAVPRARSRAFIAVLALLSPGLALAQESPDLGSAAPYALLGTNPVGTSGTVTCVD